MTKFMFLDKILIINLDRAEYRKEKMQRALKMYGIPDDKYVFLSAFDSEHLSNELERTLYGKNMDRTFAKGEICCTLSHIFALKFAKSQNYENVLILEDDVTICEDFVERLSLLESQLPTDWSQIYIGAGFDSLGKQISDNLHEASNLDGTYSYIVNKKYYDIIINHLMHFTTATDGEYQFLRNDKKILSYVFLPLFTYHSDEYSYICDKNRPHITIKTKKNYSDRYEKA